VLFWGGGQNFTLCFVAIFWGKNAQKLPYFEERSQKLPYLQIEFPKVAKQSRILKKNFTFFWGSDF
jgi:hypothetical protein